MSTYVKTILSQSNIEVIFIISLIGGHIFAVWWFSIHVHRFINKAYCFIIHIYMNLIAHYLNIFIW